MKFCFSLIIVFLSSCATPYQKEGALGGFSETQLDENVFQVTFRGNAYTNRERTVEFTLLRSAELALKNGYSYFAIIDSSKYTQTSSYTTPTTTYGSATVYGNTAYGSATTYGGQTFYMSKPTVSNTIICFNEKPDEVFSYNAKFLEKQLKKKHRLGAYNPEQSKAVLSDTYNSLEFPGSSIKREEDHLQYYGKAEEEINQKTYDKNLWAKALVDAKGDEQKRKAIYIKLRAKRLRAENVKPVKVAGFKKRSVQIEENAKKTITGTYISYPTGQLTRVLKSRAPEVRLIQNGNEVTGTFGTSGGKIWGNITGSKVEFEWLTGAGNNGGKGEWIFKQESDKVDGTYFSSFLGSGDWNLLRDE